MTKPKTHVSDAKKKAVKELSELIKNKKTILIASIKNLPASQFQEISKKLRGKAIVKVPKKSLIFRAIDDAKNETLKKLEENIHEDIALLFSDLDCFDLAGELIENKTPVGAKAGQESPEDIEIPAGPTDLIPGPAISELGALGLQVQVEDGKLTIKQSKVILKKGDEISEEAAGIMNKLDIKPFSVGFIPMASFDTKDNKLYAEINIDKEGTLEDLKSAFGRALPFAVEIEYVSKDTIGFLLSKAASHGEALGKLGGEGDEEEKKEGEGDEEKKEEVKEEGKASEGDEKAEEKPAEQTENQTPTENKSEGQGTESPTPNRKESVREESN